MRLGLVSALRSVAGWAKNTFGGNGYNATNPRRRILQPSRRPSQSTANELAAGSLVLMRSYARDLERNNPTARAAADGVTALVVGSGIALEPDGWDEITDQKRRKQIISTISQDWRDYAAQCTVDGRGLDELEGQSFREMFVVGEGVWRFVMLPDREIPLAVLPLESEWLDDNCMTPYAVNPDSTVQVGAVLSDRYGRPISYRIKNPEMTATQKSEEVPASAINHFFEKRRAMQTRGESWLSPVIEVLQQERDLVDAELAAAVNTSSIGVVVTSEVHAEPDTTEDGTPEDPAESLRLGGFTRLLPGDSIASFGNNRPTQTINLFRAGMRGDTAAALRCPQRFLDRDPSRANFSSQRADTQDSDRLLEPVQQAFGHATAGRLYREVLPFLCARRGFPMPKRIRYRLLPDGRPYVNPVEDIQAALNSVNGRLSTREQEISKRGGDYQSVQRKIDEEETERALAEIARLQRIQEAVNAANEKTPGLNLQWAQVATISGAATAPGAYLAAATTSQQSTDGGTPGEDASSPEAPASADPKTV